MRFFTFIAEQRIYFVALLCLFIFFGCTNDYFGIVVAHLEPQRVDVLRRNVLGMDEFRNARQIVMNDADPSCTYYKLRPQTLTSEVAVGECFGPTKMSDTGWGYWVTLTAGPRSDPRVETEFNRLLIEVENTVRASVGTSKVTKLTTS